MCALKAHISKIQSLLIKPCNRRLDGDPLSTWNVVVFPEFSHVTLLIIPLTIKIWKSVVFVLDKLIYIETSIDHTPL